MKNKNINISYEREADVLRLEAYSNAHIDYAREMGNMIIHFTKDDRPVLVEILEASKSIGSGKNVIMNSRKAKNYLNIKNLKEAVR